MSLREVQARVDSAEFTGWLGYYALEAEEMGGEQAEPSSAELGDKLRAWALQHNARMSG